MDLTEREQKLLRKLIVQYGQALIRAEREDSIILDQLHLKGLLDRYQSDWNEIVYVFPDDILKRWHNVLLPSIPTVTVSSDITSVMCKLSEYLVRIWKAIMIHGLKLTIKHTYHKQYWNKILKHLPNTDVDYSLEWLIKILLQLGWIKRKNDMIYPCQQTFDDWFIIDRNKREHALYQLWRMEFFPQDVWKQHLLLAFERLPADAAVPERKVSEWLKQIGVAADHDECQVWLEKMVRAGWIESFSHADSTEKSYRWFHSSNESNFQLSEWIIQSDHEILIPPGASLRKLGALLTQSELIQTDPVWVLKAQNSLHLNDEGASLDASSQDPVEKLRKLNKKNYPDYIYEQIRQYRLTSAPSQPTELHPCLRKIPTIWLNTSRGYHQATYQFIIEAALANQGRLKVSRLKPNHADETITELVIPEKLLSRGEHKLLIATHQRNQWQCNLSQIKAMQLILPGVNDSADVNQVEWTGV